MKFTNKTKLLALLMALMLMITAVFVGCGSEDKKDDDKKDETTVAEEKTTKTEKETEADKDEDKNTDVDEDTDEDEDDFPQPGTEGFTLEELEEAITLYASTKDNSYIWSYALSESNAILEYMLANDASAGNAKFIEEEGLEKYNSITERFGYSYWTIPMNVLVSDLTVNFGNDGAHYFGGQDNEVLYENALDYYVEAYAPNYYDVAADAVANAYADSGESVEFVDLSFVDFSVSYGEDNGHWVEIFIIETNTGWFFLTETL